MKRTTEFVLGLIGGIIGFGAAFFALFFGAVDEAVSGSSEVSSLGWAAFLFSILSIVGAVVVKFKAKIGGILMLISGIGGLFSISLFYVLPALLLVIGGLMGVLRKEKQHSLEG
ncbi:DUF4064 domain-containing protein [Melghirimyces algeriensis]|uniref:DUF4064 domain-containing protein n=1 Tax=Melghirimyces algeriensis TaxID=910412 RepID=A0A521DPS5_9BACL|nr:DUF4064 domain-containing protein [Melghirimyces algeriensis]SMO73575.1 Protein of unknown function [Melghirimyces algeriensis]